MDIVGIQKILSDAVKEYELVGNVPTEVLVTLISSDIYRKLTAAPVKSQQRRNSPVSHE